MTDALVMPRHVADLAMLPFARLRLDATVDDDLITCPLMYEDGTKLSIAIMCIAERGWFRRKAMVVISLVKLDPETKVTSVYLRKVIPYPSGPNDIHFIARLSAELHGMAWAQAATGGMGECIDMPKRPN